MHVWVFQFVQQWVVTRQLVIIIFVYWRKKQALDVVLYRWRGITFLSPGST